MKRLLPMLLLSFLSLPVAAEPASIDEVDHVALASRMLADGHFDRAKTVLTGVAEPTDLAQRADYHVVLGLVALREEQWRDAATHLDKAIFAGKTDDIIFVYLAQAYWGLQDFETTLRMIRNADERGVESAPLQLVRAQSLWKLGRMRQTWNVLQHSLVAFPAEPRFNRMMIYLLVELGLFQEAGELAAAYFDGENDVVVDDYLAFGQTLLSSGQNDAAVAFLQRAHLKFPNNPRVATQFARTLSAGGLPIAAGELLQRVAVDDDVLLLEAAEMFRQGGALERSLYMNAQVADQRAKLRQRVGILTDRQAFESVAAMEERLERLGLLSDQDVLYAVAYARFQIADHDGTERLLKRLTDPRLFESATKLRQVIAFCAENPC